MNIAAVPGSSSNRGNRILAERGVLIRVMDPSSPIEMAHAWDAYERSCDPDLGVEMSPAQFFKANIMHVALMTDGAIDCLFGIELCHQKVSSQGFECWWTNWLYFAPGDRARRGVLKRCGSTIVEIAHDVARRWAREHGVKPVMQLVGRRGWARILKSMGIERSATGWITEDQERFRNGLQ